MLKVMNNKKSEILLEEAEEMDIFENVRYEKQIKCLGILTALFIIFSKYFTLYQSSLFILAEVLAFGYIVNNPTYRLECKVIRRKTGGKRTIFGKKMYIDVQTEDGSIWTARVSRGEYAKAKKGTIGYLYFTDKDSTEQKGVFEME